MIKIMLRKANAKAKAIFLSQTLPSISMKNTLVLLFMILCRGVLAQEFSLDEADSIALSDAIKTVNSSQVDSAFIYSSGCIGCEVIGDDCSCSYGFVNVYLFYKAENGTQVNLYSCCGTGEKINIKDFPWSDISKQGDKIFHSEFNSTYLTVHNDFMNLKLITLDGVREINLYDYYFDEENPHKQKNELQPARKLQKQLSESIRKINSR